MKFRFEPLEIPEVVLIEATAFGDHRGFFAETYRRSAFASEIPDQFVQDNHSRSTRGTIRGLHFQGPPRAQGKLVGCPRGEVFDVAVDIRKGSPTYGRWVGATLSDENHRMLWVPAGFAHGFQVVSETADVLYKVTDEYAPDCEGSIRWDDPEIGIRWPVPESIVSVRDAAAPAFADLATPFAWIG